MSVPKSKRAQGKLNAQTKAYDFASYTDEIVSNEKVFLKRNRWCITADLVHAVHNIAINVDKANCINIRNKNPDAIARRVKFQNLALEYSVEAETLMEIAYRDNNRDGRHISDDKIEY